MEWYIVLKTFNISSKDNMGTLILTMLELDYHITLVSILTKTFT